jgi:putative CocE/NonD family hydrolase
MHTPATIRRKVQLLSISFSVLVAVPCAAQQFDFPDSAVDDPAALSRYIPGLAQQVITKYQESDRDQYLDTLFRLQLAAGKYAEGVSTLQSLIELRRKSDPGAALRVLAFETYAKAKAKEAGGASFEEAFKREFRAAFGKMDDRTANDALYWFGGSLNRIIDDLRGALARQKGRNVITLPAAVDLIRKYQFYQSFQVIMPLSEVLTAEDDARRYLVDKAILVKTPDGAQVAAMLVRPKSATASVPTIFVFTIYADDTRFFGEARRSAAHGYAGVVAYTRGKGRSPDAPVPYEHDGDDARAVIDWISKQPWSDSRVGMYSGSYNGFTQWAAAKKLPAALKTIVPYVAAIPGQGLPMENNVFLDANYGWAFYVTNNKDLDDKIYSNPQRWQSLQENWYASGKSFRQLDSVDGTPNRWLQRWLQHPSFDKYWQDMVPYKDNFAKINIPVLTITGYFDDGQISALHYLKEHYKYNHNADHYLLIGPYDHFGAQRARKEPVLGGYAIDPVAQFDTTEVTLQWMDYVFRGGKKPELLKDKINYEVMGANEWKHAPSLEQMSNDKLTLYLTDVKVGDRYELSDKKPSKVGFLDQEVDLADRKTSNNDYYPSPVVGRKPDLSNGFSFISAPFDQPVEISGTFSGQIKASINKKDMDIGLVFYEVMPNGELFQLSYFLGRASYAEDMSIRRLLTPGKVESIPFERTRMVSRRLSKGSRLLVTLNINKNQFAQINYGSGKDVSDEDINDAKIPLQIRWRNDSFVRIPIWK